MHRCMRISYLNVELLQLVECSSSLLTIENLKRAKKALSNQQFAQLYDYYVECLINMIFSIKESSDKRIIANLAITIQRLMQNFNECSSSNCLNKVLDLLIRHINIMAKSKDLLQQFEILSSIEILLSIDNFEWELSCIRYIILLLLDLESILSIKIKSHMIQQITNILKCKIKSSTTQDSKLIESTLYMLLPFTKEHATIVLQSVNTASEASSASIQSVENVSDVDLITRLPLLALTYFNKQIDVSLKMIDSIFQITLKSLGFTFVKSEQQSIDNKKQISKLISLLSRNYVKLMKYINQSDIQCQVSWRVLEHIASMLCQYQSSFWSMNSSSFLAILKAFGNKITSLSVDVYDICNDNNERYIDLIYKSLSDIIQQASTSRINGTNEYESLFELTNCLSTITFFITTRDLNHFNEIILIPPISVLLSLIGMIEYSHSIGLELKHTNVSDYNKSISKAFGIVCNSIAQLMKYCISCQNLEFIHQIHKLLYSIPKLRDAILVIAIQESIAKFKSSKEDIEPYMKIYETMINILFVNQEEDCQITCCLLLAELDLQEWSLRNSESIDIFLQYIHTSSLKTKKSIFSQMLSIRIYSIITRLLFYKHSSLLFENNLEYLKSILDSLDYISSISYDNDLLSLSLCVIPLMKDMFHLLGLYGDLMNQTRLLIAFGNIENTITNDFFKKALRNVLAELNFSFIIQCIVYNIQDLSKCSLASSKEVASIQSYFLKTITSYTHESYSEVASLITLCNNLLHNSYEELLISTLDEKIETITQQLRDHKSSTYIQVSIYRLSEGILMSSILLLVSKVMMLHYGSLQHAYKFIRRAIALSTTISSSHSYDIATYFIRYESFLHYADIYESCGLVDLALSYLSEAVNLRIQCISDFVNNLITLHSIRLYYRINSSKLPVLLDSSFTSNIQGDSLSLLCQESKDNIAKYIHIMKVNKEDELDVDPNVFAFRYQFLCWSRLCPRQYNSYFPLSWRQSLRKQYQKRCIPNKSNHFICNSFNTNKHPSSDIQDLLALLSSIQDHSQTNNNLYFDIIRDVRRMIVQQSLVESNNLSTSQLFLFGSSSCSVSLENIFAFSSNPLEVLSSPYSFLTLSSQAIKTSCTSTLNEIESHKICELIQKSLSTNRIVCFMNIEPIYHNLVIGRCSQSDIVIVTLSLGQQMKDILEEWDSIIKENDRLLKLTWDINLIKSWKDKEKKKWWDERIENDKALDDFLCHLEQVIGGWRCLLFPNINDHMNQNLKDNKAMDDLVNTMNKVSINVNINGNEKQIVNFDKVSPFIRIIQNGLKVSSNPLTMEEAIQCLSQVLKSHYPEMKDFSTIALSILSNSLTTSSNDNDNSESQTPSLELLETWKVNSLKDELKQRGLSTMGKKQELIDRLLQSYELDTSNQNSKVNNTLKSELVLMIDENLQVIPWESIPCLRDISCYRIPSLTILLGMIQAQKTTNALIEETRVDLSKAWYLVDPDNNLPTSKSTMMSYLSRHVQQRSWKGYVSQACSVDEAK